MDARIEARGAILLAGMSFYGDPFATASAWDEDNEIGALWRRFSAFLSESPNALRDRIGAERWFELHITRPETARTGRYEVFAGVEVGSASGLPLACSAKVLPAAEYAVFSVRGPDMEGDWMGRLYSELVSALGREADASYCVELYDSRFKGMDRLMESELEYWIPLLTRQHEKVL